MGRRLRVLVGALKDKASLGRATLLCSSSTAAATTTSITSSPHLVVLRATTHHPSTDPPHPRHIQALLAFGHGSRLAAAAFVDALIARLRTTRDAAVALKTLLAVHHAVARGAFILRDQLSTALHPASGQNPLNLSSFRDGSSHESWALSAWVRWYARVLELLLAASRVIRSFPNPNRALKGEADDERVSSLLNADLLRELDPLVGFVEETRRVPEAPDVEGNGLVRAAVSLIEEDTITAEREILVRVREMGERLGSSLRFSDSVELVCLLRRFEDCSDRPLGEKWTADDGERFRADVRGVMKRAGEVVLRVEEERERGRRVRRESVSQSARIVGHGHMVPADRLRFGSSRWSDS